MSTIDYSATEYHSLRHSVSDRAFDLIAQYRAEKFSQFIKPTYEVFEFGCGPGWNIVRLKAARRVGCDVATQYAESIERCGVQFAPSLDALAGEKFDVVFTSHVLEHLINPTEALKGLRGLLKHNGKIVAIVPFDKQQHKHDPSNTNHHLYIWDVHTLTELVMACGYKVESCRIARYGFDRFAAKIAVHSPFAEYHVYRILLWVLRRVRLGREIQIVLRTT